MVCQFQCQLGVGLLPGHLCQLSWCLGRLYQLSSCPGRQLLSYPGHLYQLLCQLVLRCKKAQGTLKHMHTQRWLHLIQGEHGQDHRRQERSLMQLR